MLKRKKPKMLRKRRLIDVASGRRRVSRNMSILKLHRRRRSFQSILDLASGAEATA
ncbi:MAG: hypothetical protein KAX67_00075 [Pararheinheimera sp.]|jgi:hypothetical protein|nr:hypothetical protein [Rheinheimera sp.]